MKACRVETESVRKTAEEGYISIGRNKTTLWHVTLFTAKQQQSMPLYDG